ncbi:MAG: (2Fe-2S)-binding protein [Sulfurospirillum sp.]|nr:(2Fe-2S)-binding protein [Sulfurospirillum sp.]
MATISVDGKEIQVRENALLIEELLSNDINIPHFCYHPALGKDGNCRMCMVEIEGKKRPQIACDTPVKDGMIIRTKGKNIENVKRSILELELINHPIDCPICDQAGECALQNYYMDVGLYSSKLKTPKTRGKKHVDLGSNVMLDQERCILCTRCIRFTKNITKTDELGVVSRSDHSVISTFAGHPLSNPYAMNVVDLCPVGALTSKDFRFHKRVWFLKSDNAICNRCAKGCAIFVDHHKAKYEQDDIFRYRPRFNALVNGYFICDAGRLSYKDENENRKSLPSIRGNDCEYEYAMLKILRLLKHNQSKAAFIISASLSLEEIVLIKKLANKYNATLDAYDHNYNEQFGDDFLRKSDLASNRNGLKALHVSCDETLMNEHIAQADLLLFVGYSDLSSFDCTHKTVLGLSQNIPKKKDDFAVFLPFKTHTSKAGSYINADWYLQFSQAEIAYANETKNLIELCCFYKEIASMDVEQIWQNELQAYFPHVNFQQLRKNSIKIESL